MDWVGKSVVRKYRNKGFFAVHGPVLQEEKRTSGGFLVLGDWHFAIYPEL